MTALFGFGARPALLKRRPRAPIASLALIALMTFGTLITTVALTGCSSVKSRIHEHEGDFATYPPEVQAQIQHGRIDVGFTEDMVYMALGEPVEKSKDHWKYTKPGSLFNNATAPGSLSAPYGYPGPATGPAQATPMFYDRETVKVWFKNGKVSDWDEGLQEKAPPLGNARGVK